MKSRAIVLSSIVAVGCGAGASDSSSEDFTQAALPLGNVTFECTATLEEGTPAEAFSFDILDVDGDEPRFREELDASHTVVDVPETSLLYGLNAGTQISFKTGRMIVSGDDNELGGDGNWTADLVLYQNAGYRKGYVRVHSGDGEEISNDYYSKVSCSIRTADSEGPRCGGFAGLACEGDLFCHDEPNDSCDPNNGGADCSGICVQAFGDTPCSRDADCGEDTVCEQQPLGFCLGH